MQKITQLLVLFFIVTGFSVQSQVTDVWDFGATQLDNTLFNNQLNETVINSWYDSAITPGSAGTTNTFPIGFTAGVLSWTGGASDRLRTTNTALTRYDNNIASVATHNGRVYCNAFAPLSNGMPTSRYFTLALEEDDEVKIIARGDTAGSLSFVFQSNPELQSDSFPITATSGSVTEASFVAKNAGNYIFYDASAKASIYRVYRKDAVYTSITGNVDVPQAGGIPDGYSVIFTNEAGKSWTAEINSGVYTVSVPVGYAYNLSLTDASGYIITTGDAFNTTGVTTPSVTHNIAITGVNLVTVSGSISGLGTAISNIGLMFTPDPESNSVYTPSPAIDFENATYTVQLEPNIEYTLTAQNVNDFEVIANTLTVTNQNTTFEIAFTTKPVYPVTITTTGLTENQLSDLQLTFTNLNESGYSYTFEDMNSIALRNGTYGISFSGLDNHAVELGLTSNSNVNGSAVSKIISFIPVTVWSFNDKAISSTTTAYYKGMILTGQVSTVTSSGHLTAKTEATIQVPILPNHKVVVSYYYSANFSIEGGTPITTASNSTSIVENIEYAYTGFVPGNVTITVGGPSNLTSYFTEIKTVPNVAYSEIITVGVDKQYQTINEALLAISNMTRTSSDRVTVMIDSGNYEEMLVITQPNITLKNASANPNIDLINSGVSITDGAVRVTSYYGHGYNYYSMASNQKWNQETLSVNLENGNFSYQNAGAGTTNGSFWNATVVVNANGFEADDIIFENSFNQYISTKESQDVVVAWSSGSPGARPTNSGNTEVQNKIFVERASALAVNNNVQKVVLNKCRIVGRQDTFFGGTGARVAVYKGNIMGAVDYIFGGMNAVFYKTELSMNTSDQSNDVSYITAPQQASGRGYLMYECTVTTAEPLVETASAYRSKPGYFGRPWLATTSEVVFYNTTIETSNFPGYDGNSLILPLGWQNTLGGTSSGMYEYGTIENSGIDNSAVRANWATSLTNPVLNDGTSITPFNFTKGTDDWDPFPELINNDLGVDVYNPVSEVNVFAVENSIYIRNVLCKTQINVYAINGALIKSIETVNDTNIDIADGIWIVTVQSADGNKAVKVITH
ncbi:exo-poly-alpha-galacturonosidase [Flavobacterium arsenatis]|uniref:Exo-poly-alpha-galacturonosidase n=1 Tax=Flavobacterium arsenatis TaxID=1484332 RepID=A0ABU1TU82_9FLAO|nr:pectinesterase family protein [Flavobacterium arsenatis]MDR6969400.1 exo-poly-alpha-galacturonosidase [Flavobacterium arsenatis]